MGYVTFYKLPGPNKPKLEWFEEDWNIEGIRAPNLMKENVTFEDFKSILEEHKIIYGTDGFLYYIHWASQKYRGGEGFGIEYIDRGFNN